MPDHTSGKAMQICGFKTGIDGALGLPSLENTQASTKDDSANGMDGDIVINYNAGVWGTLKPQTELGFTNTEV